MGEEEEYLNPLFSVFGRLFTSKNRWRPSILYIKREGSGVMWKMNKNILSGVLQALRCAPMTSLTTGCFKAEREDKKKKTLDNHQCLQYLSSKRLKAHIADNWI